MKTVDFSIIIPHRNTQVLLRKCLESIPDEEDVQVIVVDDNSDNGECLPDLRRSNVEYVLMEEHRTAGYARNAGLERATGNWVLFADADDYFNDGFLPELRKYRDSQADVIFFKVRGIDLKTGEKAVEREYINLHIENALKGMETYYNVSKHSHAPWGKMIRRQLIVDNNLAFDDTLHANDVMFSTKVTCLFPKLDLSSFVLYVVTKHEGSLSANRLCDNDSFLQRFEISIKRNLYFIEHGVTGFYLIPMLVVSHGISLRTRIKCVRLLWMYDHFWYSVVRYGKYRLQLLVDYLWRR